MAKFEKGTSGNPAGRKPGMAKIEPLRQAIQGHIPYIINTLVDLAKSGDTSAAKLLLERALPPLRPVQEPIRVAMDGDNLTARSTAVVDAVAEGQLSPVDAKLILDGLAAFAKILETDDLAKRIEALENQRGK